MGSHHSGEVCFLFVNKETLEFTTIFELILVIIVISSSFSRKGAKNHTKWRTFLCDIELKLEMLIIIM